MDNLETVIIYQTWWENSAKLGEEKQNKVIRQIIEYGLYGTIPNNETGSPEDLLFCSWQPLVDSYKRNRAYGKMGGRGHKKAENNSDEVALKGGLSPLLSKKKKKIKSKTSSSSASDTPLLNGGGHDASEEVSYENYDDGLDAWKEAHKK